MAVVFSYLTFQFTANQIKLFKHQHLSFCQWHVCYPIRMLQAY